MRRNQAEGRGRLEEEPSGGKAEPRVGKTEPKRRGNAFVPSVD